jgi:uncharacterized protein
MSKARARRRKEHRTIAASPSPKPTSPAFSAENHAARSAEDGRKPIDEPESPEIITTSAPPVAETAKPENNSEVPSNAGAGGSGGRSASARPSHSIPVDVTGKIVLGFVNFDARAGSGTDSSMLVDHDYITRFRRGSYVEVESARDGNLYLGRLVEGPFFSPDYVGIDSSIARLAIQKAELLKTLPDYHAIGLIEILGLMDRSGNLRGHSTRPLPQSIVYAVEGDGLTKLLNLEGRFRLGHLDGYDAIAVNFDDTSKKVLPRNVGIFGTVGSGKTNTSQVIIEEAARLGWAVVVLDVEGEYVEMNRGNDEGSMVARLKDLGLSPEGIKDFAVYHPVNCDADDDVESSPFSITFGRLNPYMVAELLGMNDTQEDRFLQAYDACMRFPTPPAKKDAPKTKRGKKASDDLGIEKLDDEAATESNNDQDPQNRLGASIADLLDDTVDRKVTLEQLINRISQWIDDDQDDFGRKLSYPNSWSKVRSQLIRLQRFRLFDTGASPLDAAKLIHAGRVSVINLSDSLEPRVNNLVIADVLGRLFAYKLEHQEPHAIIVIEEAHTFVSKENVRRMEATMEKLREIARRGRKRWLGLTFISQQPSHLPQELYELCNNLFVHETKGHKNLDALKSSAGSINEGIWHDVPTLGQGRAIVVSPQFRHPVVTKMNPSRAKRRLTD